MVTPLLSINIVSYNTKDITVQCLRSIERSIRLNWLTQNPANDIEIVIIDNASTDNSIEAIEGLQKDFIVPIKLVKNSENIGFGKGHNKAAQLSLGESLLLLNTDTILLKDALFTLVKDFLSHNPTGLPQYNDLVKNLSSGEKVHFAGPKLLNENLSPQPSCGPYYSIPVIFGAIFLRGDHWGLTRWSPNIDSHVDWVSGAAIICKKDSFQELGGFDEKIFMYMEEIELLHRATKKGMQVWVFPKSQIIHLGSASSNKTYPIFQVYRGFLYLYTKHHKALELHMVQLMLAMKAKIAIGISKLFNKPNIAHTYYQALKIVEERHNQLSDI